MQRRRDTLLVSVDSEPVRAYTYPQLSRDEEADGSRVYYLLIVRPVRQRRLWAYTLGGMPVIVLIHQYANTIRTLVGL